MNISNLYDAFNEYKYYILNILATKVCISMCGFKLVKNIFT